MLFSNCSKIALTKRQTTDASEALVCWALLVATQEFRYSSSH